MNRLAALPRKLGLVCASAPQRRDDIFAKGETRPSLIRRLRAALEAIAQGTEQPAAGQVALDEALDTDNYLAENAQNVVDDQKEPTPSQ